MTGFVYEVSLSIEASIERDYLIWLREHVSEMLSLDCFTGVQIFEQRSLDFRKTKVIRVLYKFNNPEDFKTYEKKWAQEMRDQLPAHFLDKVSVERHILVPSRLEDL